MRTSLWIIRVDPSAIACTVGGQREISLSTQRRRDDDMGVEQKEI